MVYRDANGEAKTVPLERAAVEVSDDNKDTHVTVRFFDPATQQHQKLVFEATTPEERDSFAAYIQQRIDFQPSHLGGLSVRFDDVRHVVACNYHRCSSFALSRGHLKTYQTKRGHKTLESSASLVDARATKLASGLGITITVVVDGKNQNIDVLATSEAEQAKWLQGVQREIFRANADHHPEDML